MAHSNHHPPGKGKRKRLLNHLDAYHTASSHYVASGSKQVKVLLALHTSDQLRGVSARACLMM